MTRSELNQIINDAEIALSVCSDHWQAGCLQRVITLAREHTPTDPEPVEIPLDEWWPHVGDVVEWPNGERYTVSEHKNEMIPICEAPAWCARPVSDQLPLFRAAKCRIWRNP